MKLPNSSNRQKYIEDIKIIEADIKDATDSGNHSVLLAQIQKRLDKLAETYQYDEEIGTALYKMYELQALVYYFEGKDSDALNFINQAVTTRGDDYVRANKIKKQLLEKSSFENTKGHRVDDAPPLQLQALIRGQRTSAIIMVLLSIITVYFIPWAIFYIVLAVKLNPQRVPSRGLIKAAAILTLPLCLGLIPIIIDMEFWRMNKKLQEYEELGAKAFISNKEYSAAEPKRKKSNTIAWSILLSIIAILAIFITVAIITSSSSNQSSSTASLAESTVSELKSDSTFVLPQEVDGVTTLTDVTANGNVVQYHYIIHDADTSNLSDDSLRSSIQPNVCSNTSTKNLLDQGIDMQYMYTVKDASLEYSFTVTKSNC